MGHREEGRVLFLDVLGVCGNLLPANMSVEIVPHSAEKGASRERKGRVMVRNRGAKRR